MVGLIDGIIDELNEIELIPKDKKKAEKVIEKLTQMKERIIEKRKDLEKNIGNTLKAVDLLKKIEDVDMTSVHIKLSELLRINEVKWSRWE